jgi:hypothetical protein
MYGGIHRHLCRHDALMVLALIFKPSIQIKRYTLQLYWPIALVGALVLVLSWTLPPTELWQGLTADSTVNPGKILVLFLSMAILSIVLDELGFFAFSRFVGLAPRRGQPNPSLLHPLSFRLDPHRLHQQRYRDSHLHPLHHLLLQGCQDQSVALSFRRVRWGQFVVANLA